MHPKPWVKKGFFILSTLPVFLTQTNPNVSFTVQPHTEKKARVTQLGFVVHHVHGNPDSKPLLQSKAWTQFSTMCEFYLSGADNWYAGISNV